jgi:hypothetical protein
MMIGIVVHQVAGMALAMQRRLLGAFDIYQTVLPRLSRTVAP